MSRDAKTRFPRPAPLWIAGVFGALGVAFLCGCSMFRSPSSIREKETIYHSDATEKRTFFSPATGPKTAKQFLAEPRVPLPPQT